MGNETDEYDNSAYDLTAYALTGIANVQRPLVFMEWMDLSDQASEAGKLHAVQCAECTDEDLCEAAIALRDVANGFSALAWYKF